MDLKERTFMITNRNLMSDSNKIKKRDKISLQLYESKESLLLIILDRTEIWNSLDKIKEEKLIKSSMKTFMKDFKISNQEIGSKQLRNLINAFKLILMMDQLKLYTTTLNQ